MGRRNALPRGQRVGIIRYQFLGPRVSAARGDILEDVSSHRPQGRRPSSRPSHVFGELRLLEASFIRAYLTDARGNGRQAARLAGYRGSVEVLDVQAARLLKRPRVRKAIQHAFAAEAERRGLSKENLVSRTHEIMLQNRPIERVKAAELLCKLLGFFAQTPAPDRPAYGAQDGFAALVETLRSAGTGFTPEERQAIHNELRGVITEATKALQLLSMPLDIEGY